MRKRIFSMILTVVMTVMMACSATAEEIDHNKIASERFSYAIVLQDGSLWGWGAGMTETPTKLLDNVKKVTCGTSSDTVGAVDAFYIAIKNDNSLWGWGDIPMKHSGNKPFKIASNVKDANASYKCFYVTKMDDSVLVQGEVFDSDKGDYVQYNMKELPKKESNTKYSKYEEYNPYEPYVLKEDGTIWRYSKKIGEQWENIYDPSSLHICMNGKKFKAINRCYDFGYEFQFLGEDNVLYSATETSDFDIIAKNVLFQRDALIIKTDGSVWTWGTNYGDPYRGIDGKDPDFNNLYGELGTGSTEPFFGLHQVLPANSFCKAQQNSELEEQLIQLLVDGHNATRRLLSSADSEKPMPNNPYKGAMPEEFNTLDKARQYLKQYLTAASAEGVLYRCVQDGVLMLQDDVLYCAIADPPLLPFDPDTMSIKIEQQSENKIVARAYYNVAWGGDTTEKQFVFIKENENWKLSYDEYDWF